MAELPSVHTAASKETCRVPVLALVKDRNRSIDVLSVAERNVGEPFSRD